MSNLQLSPLVIGCWRLKNWGFSAQELLAFTEQCVELGLTTIDHAMVYRSEAPFGEALALSPAVRDKLEIVTKCGIRPMGFGELGAQSVNHYDFSEAYTLQSVDASLRDLQTDRIDLLLLHRPDFLMDVSEVADTFAKLKQQGKVLNFGVSNFTSHQVALLQSALPDALVTNQIECSPLHMDPLTDGTFDQAQQLRMRPMLWSCLAGGKLFNPETERELRVVQALQEVAAEVGIGSIDVVAYAWLLALPCKPYPVLGTSKIERVREAAKSLELKLTREQWYRIWEASNGASVP